MLIGFRLAAGLAMGALAGALGSDARVPCVALLSLGVLSDIFDGVIARRLGIVTDSLRTWDSRVDLVFWISATAAALILAPGIWRHAWPMMAVLAALETATHLVSWIRFRREASPHHLTSKLFGLGLWALLAVMLLTGAGGWLQWPVFVLGLASECEALAITLVLPAWRPDVRGLREAASLRRASGRG